MSNPPPACAGTASADTPNAPAARQDRIFWISVGIGTLMIGYGVLLFWRDPIQTWPYANEALVSPASAQWGMIRRFVVILLLHDFVLLPLVFGFAAVTFRLVPPVWRAPIKFALIVSAFVLLIAAWGLAGQAIEVQPGNRQVLPNHYPTSVALLLAPVWLAATVWGCAARRRRSRARPVGRRPLMVISPPRRSRRHLRRDPGHAGPDGG